MFKTKIPFLNDTSFYEVESTPEIKLLLCRITFRCGLLHFIVPLLFFYFRFRYHCISKEFQKTPMLVPTN